MNNAFSVAADPLLSADDKKACLCGSGRLFGQCCGPVLRNTSAAATAEALMRSRYSAYVLGYIDYLATSLHPQHRADLDLSATRRWAKQAQWVGLDVISCSAGGENDESGEVEFIATFKEKDLLKTHHERALFKRSEGVWYYVDGELAKQQTNIKSTIKVGRNQACPCGSGKKFKKCCGA